MANKNDTSRSLVTARKPAGATKRRNALTTVAEVTNAALVPIVGSELAVAKLPGIGGNVAREQGTVLVTGRGYATRDGIVPALEVYYTDARPAGDGHWLGEADKVAWRDEASGFDCIMLRDFMGGFLQGYVGVPRGHPLWGWEYRAVPADLGIQVHGGLNYSAICQHGPTPIRSIVREGRTICHVPRAEWQHTRPAHPNGYEVDDPHVWWFGFSCDHAYDVIPSQRVSTYRARGAEIAAEYRDDAYVVREVLNLAAQLRAIADGRPPPPREGPPLPPVGLDPSRGG